METVKRHPAHWSVVLEFALRDPDIRKQIRIATGYDDQKIDRIATGQHGISIDQLHPFLTACGLVVVSKDVFDAYVTMAQVGAECVLKNELWRNI